MQRRKGDRIGLSHASVTIRRAAASGLSAIATQFLLRSFFRQRCCAPGSRRSPGAVDEDQSRDSDDCAQTGACVYRDASNLVSAGFVLPPDAP